ncbi:probable helicase senataxin isoform X2 [Astyanax mexicanus]|uniref:probable helicase senataxin isoform X2 n=1 Tax=Astyanax mexicanus TaxID=7994 RepID=UPI0020CAA4B9|nr:probable helicase senataxin isoform X2 [Astyanax mexicanus]
MATCLWCRALAESDADVAATLQSYSNGGMTPTERQGANDDLIYCSDCVEKYHELRERVPALHERLWEIETTRLLEVFREMFDSEMEEDDLYLVENGKEQPISGISLDEIHDRLRSPFMEVLKYPYLLCHQGLCEMVVNVLCKMEELNSPLHAFEKYQGIYLLMVHPNETVRRWAIATAKSKGSVDRDSFYSLQEAFFCMFMVLELGITLKDKDVNTFYSGSLPHHLPLHLYDTENEKNYWLGICMLLMQLDSQAMESLFMGPNKQCNIPQCIMNTMKEERKGKNMASDPFWPALQCFMVILDRLGSKIWCEIDLPGAFGIITQAASYVAEVQNIRQKTKGTRVKEEPDSDDYDDDDNMVTCSQMVYDHYPTDQANRASGWSSNRNEKNINEIIEDMGSLVDGLQSEMGQGIRVYGSTFLWFIPYVRSVMELGDLGNSFIDEVMQYLYTEVNKDVLSGETQTWDKVTEFFIIILIDIIELLLGKGCMRTLHYCAPTWVKVIVQCSMLETCINAVPNRRSGSYRVTFASSAFGKRNQILANGVCAVSQASMRLIRSLLKEGERIVNVTVTDLARFLDLLNRHLRGNKVWDLQPSDSKNLQNCITMLLNAVVARTATTPNVPSAPPTSPADPPENVMYPSATFTDPLQEPRFKNAATGPCSAVNFMKEEPLCEEYRDYFCDNLEDIKPKKEPCSPVPVSKLQPTLELNHLKPDFNKINEIKCKLNDSSKIQAFTKSRLDPIEQNQNEHGHLKETVKITPSSSSDTTSQSTISNFAKAERPSKKKQDYDYDDEPLNVRRRRLKQTHEISSSETEDSKSGIKTSMQVSSHAKEVSDLIVISDDEVATTDQILASDSSSESPVNRVAYEPSSDHDLNESPGREYDNDFSESQVFEFETQENIASAWTDPYVDHPVNNKKPKRDCSLKISTSPATVEPTSSWVNNTQPVTDEEIEKACQEVEEQVSKQQLQDAPTSSTIVPPKPKSSAAKWDNFTKPKSVPLRSPTKKLDLGDKRGQQCSNKKSLLIEPLDRKVKKRRSSLSTASTECPVSSVTPSASMVSERSSFVSRDSRLFPSPAIVPPKKIRKAVEPESVAERMGLKKKERKAFDLSQRTLDTLGELRTHGQSVHVEQPQKSKRVCRKSKPQPQLKLAGKGGKKLLASQDMQYFRQSKGMLKKSTPANATLSKPIRNHVPKNLPKSKRTVENVLEPGEGEAEDDYDEEEDDYQKFLPCSQPDPARKNHQNDRDRKNVSESHKIKPILFDAESKGPSPNQVADRNEDSTASNTDTKWVGYCVDDKDYDEDLWPLTQNESIDMELCTQTEETEANWEFPLTQRDPVDMDIDMDSQPHASDGGPDVQTKPQPAFIVQDAPPAALIQKPVDESGLFLKPGMSPVSQKKAKPSTTKIYAPSSRIDSLVGEMEKTTKTKVVRPPPVIPPPSKTVPQPCKPQKAVPQSSALPKAIPQPSPKAVLQSDFKKPLPCLRRPPPVQGLKSAVQNNIASHPPSYKTYSRPEDPVVKSAVTRNQPQWFDQSLLTQAILKWEFRMFENYRGNGLPDDLCPWPLKEVPTTFSTHEEYFSTMYPLLLANLFEEMVSEWQRSGRVEISLKVQGLESTNHTASFTASLGSEQEMRQYYPKEDDLVLLWLPKNKSAYASGDPDVNERHASFGCVSRSSVINNGAGQHSTLNLTIQTRGNVSSVNTQHVRCEVIGSLITTMREFRALCHLKSGIMARPYILLKPHVSVFTPCQESLPDLDMPEYNTDQAKAISCGVAMVKRRQYSAPKILLIHGPPGTGKSKTIVGLLQRLFSEHNDNIAVNRHSKSHRMRVLLCAPSNAAIDNLMKKVILAFKEKCRDINSPQGNCGDINLVRLGSEKTISKSLTGFSLDSQTSKKTQMRADPDVQRQKHRLDQAIENLSRQCAITQKQSPEFKQLMDKKQHYLSEREKLSRHLREFRSKRQEVQAGVLRDAHVICCTLSTSGSLVLETAFRRHGREPFSCVIVDEAGQAKEAESLIPLLHRCPALILVGDPDQLTPTVVSQKAKELGYDQSLMARLWKSLHPSNPSIFLSIQYRMHPDICSFPSKYIYGNRLKNDWAGECLQYRHLQAEQRQLYRFGLRWAGPCYCETAQKRCSVNWPFEPYRVFDVMDGRENKENDSFSNQKEVKLILMLLKLIGEKQVVRVGVITPYNAQKQQILRAVNAEARGNKTLQVEVDTVDGFQGREMECIIVSCVRASSEMGSIGFVGNRQRMNVTITRAKQSLFILGHLRTLREHSDWGALIKDADRRGTIIKTQEQDFREATTKILKPERSHPHTLTSRRSSNPTSAPQPVHIPVETPTPPIPIPLSCANSNGSHSPTVSSTTSGPSDRPRDPRLTTRPSDPRLSEPVREHRQDRERQDPTDPRRLQRHSQDPRTQRDHYRRSSIPPTHSSSYQSPPPRRRSQDHPHSSTWSSSRPSAPPRSYRR